MPRKVQAWIYYLTAFVCGAAVMAMEMTAARLLAPYFGNSLIVWTNVIGLVMLGLAVGYYVGGRVADKRPLPQLYFGAVFFTGLWALALPFVAPFLFEALLQGFPDLSTMVRLGSFLAVLLLLVLPMFLLGMVVPFTVKLVTPQLSELGRCSGRVSMVSTVGSLLGTFLPAFVLLPTLGTTRSFVFLGALLMALALLGWGRRIFLSLLLLPVLAWFQVPSVFEWNPFHEDLEWVYTAESAYASVLVGEDEAGVRHLYAGTRFGVQSIYDPEQPLTGKYYYAYFGVLPALIEAPETVLILGHGAGSFTRIFQSYYPDMQITAVELDPVVTEAALHSMDLNLEGVDLVHADARSFLQADERRYDLVLIDTYHGTQIPAHLATQEFFELVMEHVADEGVVAVNLSAGASEFKSGFMNTLASMAGGLWDLPIEGAYNSMLFFGSDLDWTFPNLPEALSSHAEEALSERSWVTYDPAAKVFTDSYASEVETLSEAALLNLLSRY